MIRSCKGFFLVILLLLISCRQVEPTNLITPTPFEAAIALPRIPAMEPIPISLTQLAANPEFYEGSTLQLAGEYQKLPILVCDHDPHPGPGSWGIVDNGLLANASGHDKQLRSLLVENQPITVEGHWLRYNGPIGCGKSAPVQEVWYLSVNRIIEPHPLARATKESVTQSGEPTAIAALPETATMDPLSSEEIPADPTLGMATATLFVTATSITVEPIVTLTSTTEPNVEPTPAASVPPSPSTPTDITITPDLSRTSTPTAVTSATATGTITTPEDETSTPGPSPTPSLTPSPSPEGHNFNDKGSIDYEDLKIETLQSGLPDQWTLAVDTSDSITITIAPATTANITISIIDETGATIVDAQDQSPDGEVETITALSLTTPGLYEIYIETEPAVQTDYALMVMNSESYSFSFQGTLIPSSPRNDSLQPDNDHFWFFPMAIGNKINMRVIPNSQADPYLELYDPQGSRVLTIDNTGTGESESLEDYEATLDGLYGIRVGEFDFAAMSYQILLTQS